MHGIVSEIAQGFFLAMDLCLWFPSVDFRAWMASLIQRSWSVLMVILLTLKEVWSSLMVISCSVQMISWLLSHIARQLSFIHFSWALDQRQPLAMLQEALTFFWNLFHAVLMATSSVSKQVRQSPKADSGLESATFSLDSSWVDSSPQWSVLSSLSCSLLLPEATKLLLGTSSGI